MLKIARVLLLGLLLIFWFLFGLLLCLVRPRHPNNVYVFARMYHAVCPLNRAASQGDGGRRGQIGRPGGLCLQPPEQLRHLHRDRCGAAWRGGRGQKSLLWLPLFGLIFWLSGNVLIDRSNRSRAIGTIGQVVDRIKNRGTSIWMFPEGTRSQGRGLLPFKAGAFHTAVQAEVPVVPIVCSSYFGQVDLNRWDNGEVLVEVMAPVCSKEHGASGIRDLSDTCRARMEAKLAELDSKLGHSHAA